jgi:histidinol phosphatase-like PHP family hydrolase
VSTTAVAPFIGSQDLHCHTDMSDGHLSLARVVEVAASRGVQVGVADHVSARNPAMMVSSAAEVRRYLEAIEAAPVLRSAEFCWCDTLWRVLPGELMQRFDYRIGSNHGWLLPDGTLASPWWPALPSAWAPHSQQVMEVLVDSLCQLVRTMPVHIVAHSTLLPPALLRLEEDPLAWWSEPREERYVQALRESGVALEISNRYRLPHDRLLLRARDAGVRFSLGSDGHREQQVAALDWAVATAKRVGIRDDEMFVPQERVGGR